MYPNVFIEHAGDPIKGVEVEFHHVLDGFDGLLKGVPERGGAEFFTLSRPDITLPPEQEREQNVSFMSLLNYEGILLL
jgi:hypothetical protein